MKKFIIFSALIATLVGAVTFTTNSLTESQEVSELATLIAPLSGQEINEMNDLISDKLTTIIHLRNCDGSSKDYKTAGGHTFRVCKLIITPTRG